MSNGHAASLQIDGRQCRVSHLQRGLAPDTDRAVWVNRLRLLVGLLANSLVALDHSGGSKHKAALAARTSLVLLRSPDNRNAIRRYSF